MSMPVKLHRVTPEMNSYRDLSPQELRSERNVQIGLIAGGSLVLIGVIVGLVLLEIESPGVFSQNYVGKAFLGIFGGGGGLALIFFGFSVNYETRNGWAKDNLQHIAALEIAVDLLTEDTLEAVYKKYYRNNGGLPPLVRGGLLTTAQAKRLSTLLDSYHANRVTRDDYNNNSNANFKMRASADKYSAYVKAITAKQGLEKEWETLRGEIKKDLKQRETPLI